MITDIRRTWEHFAPATRRPFGWSVALADRRRRSVSLWIHTATLAWCTEVFLSTVIQGRDITVVLPPQIFPAMTGLPPTTPTFTGRDSDLTALLGTRTPVANPFFCRHLSPPP